MNMTSLRATSTVALSIGLLLAAAGCVEDVTITPATEGSTGDGSGGTTVTAASTSSASGGTGGVDTGAGGSAVCMPQPDTTGTFMEPTCADLAGLAVSNAVIADAGGDGNVDAGESAVLQVNLAEIAGLGFNHYPGVAFESSSAGVTVTANDWFYAILPCQTNQVSAQLTIASDVAPGTVVMITARVAMLNNACLDAPAIVIPITVH